VEYAVKERKGVWGHSNAPVEYTVKERKGVWGHSNAPVEYAMKERVSGDTAMLQ